MKRTDMNNVKDILRQRHALGLSRDDIAAAIGVSAGTVSNVLRRAAAAGLSCWPLPDGLDDEQGAACRRRESLTFFAGARPLPREMAPPVGDAGWRTVRGGVARVGGIEVGRCLDPLTRTRGPSPDRGESGRETAVLVQLAPFGPSNHPRASPDGRPRGRLERVGRPGAARAALPQRQAIALPWRRRNC